MEGAQEEVAAGLEEGGRELCERVRKIDENGRESKDERESENGERI